MPIYSSPNIIPCVEVSYRNKTLTEPPPLMTSLDLPYKR